MEDENRISERSLRTRMLVSVFCMVLCMTAMLSSAYAWFVVSLSSDANVISGAYYQLDINEKDVTVTTDTESGNKIYVCDLAANDKHYFTMTASGTASKGYCKIIISGDNAGVYHTPVIETGSSLEVCIQAGTGSKITFEPIWGAYEAQAVYSLRRPTMFTIEHSMTPYVEYFVVEGVTLEELAEYYGVPVEDICIYNDITELTVGDVIRIPGVVDDSMEPYMPATPSNATPQNEATPSDATKAEDATSSDATPSEAATPEEPSPSNVEKSDDSAELGAADSENTDDTVTKPDTDEQESSSEAPDGATEPEEGEQVGADESEPIESTGVAKPEIPESTGAAEPEIPESSGAAESEPTESSEAVETEANAETIGAANDTDVTVPQ